MPLVTLEEERQVDLLDFKASLVGLVRVLARLCLKTRTQLRKLKKKKKTNPEPFNGGGRGYGAVVLGQEQSFGPEMRVASTDQGLHCDFFSSLGMVRLVAEAFSFEISGMVR